MSFEVQKKEKFTVVKVKAEKLDGTISPALKSELVMINANGEKNLIMDLSGSRYCDSSGLSAVLVANRLCKNSNGTFVLTGLQDPVKKLISISQLDTVLNITPTYEEAIELMMMDELERDAK